MRRYLSHPRVGRQRYGPSRVRSSRSKRSLPFRRAVWAVDLDDIHPMRRGDVKSIVDDFVLGRGVVISRAATSLRSVETQPLTRRFVRNRRTHLRYGQCKASRLGRQPKKYLHSGKWETNPPGVPHLPSSEGLQVRLLPRALYKLFST